MRKSTPFVLLAVVIAMAIVACTNAPYTGRNQLILLTQGQEAQMGVDAYQEVKANSKISANARWRDMVARVGERIKAVAERPDFQWEFNVIADPTVNAFCLPGGKVGVYTGILPVTKDEAGLATVIGHEVAHAVARHGGERMSTAMGLEAAGSVASAVLGSTKYASWGPAFNQAYGMGAQVGVALPHSRLQESEADHMGLLYMARAGFNPEASVAFWQRFAEYNKAAGGSTPWFLRTHPLDETRIQQLQQWMPEAKAQFRAAK